jgi:glyoxylase-like metal-dependent hydrolase (beta-lactamase superfamily II)
MHQSDLPQSRHFELQEIATGTYTAIAKEGGWAISNSGMFDLGHETLVFDTLLTPRAAKDLRLFAEYLFRRSPDIVINSHYHSDHIWGNQAFLPGAQFVSTDLTRELIVTEGAEELRYYNAHSAERLAQLQAVASADGQPQAGWLSYYEALNEELPHLQVCLPTITFDNRLQIHGTAGEAHLISFSGAHTGSDTLLYLPQQGVVFMSDLLFIGYHPYLADGNPYQWLKVLHEVRQIDADYFVPGHGPVGTRADLDRLIAYIEHCIETSHMMVREGMGSDDYIELLTIPEEYAGWQMPDYYYANLRFLCRRLAEPSQRR